MVSIRLETTSRKSQAVDVNPSDTSEYTAYYPYLICHFKRREKGKIHYFLSATFVGPLGYQGPRLGILDQPLEG